MTQTLDLRSASLQEKMSFDAIRDLVSNALREKHRLISADERPWIRELYDDKAIYQLNSKTYQATYSITVTDGTSSVTLGDPIEVVQTYIPVTAVAESHQELKESVQLTEKAVRKNGTVSIRLIKPGWGTSGFYPVSVLERDGPKVFKTGLKMFWNHQTEAEEAERPEGKLENLAGELVSDARYLAEGPVGPGLYGEAKVFKAKQAEINELASHIGVSLRGYGEVKTGEAEGRKGPVVNQITGAKSVDFVTSAGAGGRILELVESFRHRTKEEDVPETTELERQLREASGERDTLKTRLQEAESKVETVSKERDELKSENERFKEGAMISKARTIAVTKLSEHKDMPEITKTRIAEAVASNPPIKEGKLDEEEVVNRTATKLKEEAEYLATIMPNDIVGFGSSENGDGSKITDEKLEESFKALGLSDVAAKEAAAGR